MGDCTSRPEPTEEEAHAKYNDSSNDKHFIYKPQNESLSKYAIHHINTADDQHRAIESIKALDKQISYLTQQVSKISDKKPPQPSRLLIEIQKAKEIYPSLPCYVKAVPFVSIELVPLKITYSTSVGTPFIPKWYELFTHKQGLDRIEKILIKLKLRTKFGKKLVFGTNEIDIRELREQDVVDKWLAIKCKEEVKGSPAVKIRIQAVLDEEKIAAQSAQSSKELLPVAKKMRDDIEKKLKLCEEAIGPEGLG